MAGRRTTPLFDLLSRTQATTPAPTPPRVSKPVVRVELKPREPSYAPEPAPEPVAAPVGRPRMHTASLWAAGVMVCLVAAFSIGWVTGRKRGEQDMAHLVPKREPPAIQEPDGGMLLSAVPPVNQPRIQPRTQPASTARPPVQATIQPTSQPTGQMSGAELPPVVNPKALPPATGIDPREPGLNYIYLATLPYPDASRAVDFLRSNGVDAHFIVVDPGSGPANNPGPDAKGRVFVLPGLSTEQYRQSIRTNLELEVVRLGSIWQREHRGSSNFEKFGWEKLK